VNIQEYNGGANQQRVSLRKRMHRGKGSSGNTWFISFYFNFLTIWMCRVKFIVLSNVKAFIFIWVLFDTRQYLLGSKCLGIPFAQAAGHWDIAWNEPNYILKFAPHFLCVDFLWLMMNSWKVVTISLAQRCGHTWTTK
jgi:hypothetical protein